MEQGYRSEVQERALVVSLQMFNLILERGVSLLKAQLESVERPRLVVVEDMQILLPAIKVHLPPERHCALAALIASRSRSRFIARIWRGR